MTAPEALRAEAAADEQWQRREGPYRTAALLCVGDCLWVLGRQRHRAGSGVVEVIQVLHREACTGGAVQLRWVRSRKACHGGRPGRRGPISDSPVRYVPAGPECTPLDTAAGCCAMGCPAPERTPVCWTTSGGAIIPVLLLFFLLVCAVCLVSVECWLRMLAAMSRRGPRKGGRMEAGRMRRCPPRCAQPAVPAKTCVTLNGPPGSISKQGKAVAPSSDPRANLFRL